MDAQKLLEETRELISTSQDILIVLHRTPTPDSIGSGLSMYLGLQSMGKNVTIVMPVPITVELSNFVGADKIKQTIGSKNFVISLNYKDGSIEKVSYNIEGDKFNLVIEPRQGFESFNERDVSYTYSGTKSDCIIAIDTANFGEMGSVYEEQKDIFATKPIIVIDKHATNSLFGKINIVDSASATSAELIAVVLSSLGVELTEDIATNLLNAIYESTDNFQLSQVSARTFEVASVCMKAGGKRFRKTEGQTVIAPAKLGEPDEENKPKEQPIEKISLSVNPDEPKQTNPYPPKDWLKPKIFKSTNIS